MKAIVAVDRNWGIGKGNDLLVHLPGDLKYYKEKTLGKVIIVGQKTLESFPGGRPLPGRTNIVLSDDPSFERDDCVICRTRDEVMAKVAGYDKDNVFVCGGGSIYKLFLEDCEELYVTKIDAEFDADTFFPNLDELGYEIDWESEPKNENGIDYRFVRYVKSC